LLRVGYCCTLAFTTFSFEKFEVGQKATALADVIYQLSSLSYKLSQSLPTTRSKGRGASRPQAVGINPSSVQYQKTDVKPRLRIMKAPHHAQFPGPGFDIPFWFALFSPLVGLMGGFIIAWFFSSLAP
jgi:hypothetical protein